MARYFFDVATGDREVLRDSEGSTLADMEAVTSEAVALAFMFGREQLSGVGAVTIKVRRQGDGVVLVATVAVSVATPN